jgi:hypothetical protein
MSISGRYEAMAAEAGARSTRRPVKDSFNEMFDLTQASSAPQSAGWSMRFFRINDER